MQNLVREKICASVPVITLIRGEVQSNLAAYLRGFETSEPIAPSDGQTTNGIQLDFEIVGARFALCLPESNDNS